MAESPDDLDDIGRNIMAAYGVIAGRSGRGQVVPDRHLVLIDCGLPNPELNIAFVLDDERIEESLAEAHRFFSQRERPWRLEAPVGLTERLDPLARRLGLGEFGTRPALALRTSDLRPAPVPSDLDIRVVDTPNLSRTFWTTLNHGMSGTPPSGEPPTIDVTDQPGLTCYLALQGGTPVGTGVLFVHRCVAGIYGIATVPAARRRGIGRAISERAVRDGFQSGARLGALQASEMGKPVYLAMGFHWVFDRAVWSS